MVIGLATREGHAVPGLKRSRWTRFKAGLSRRFGWLWQPLLYAGILIGFLLGRAVPASQVMPFGIAFYAAVRAAGFGPTAALPVAVAVFCGSLSAVGVTQQVIWVGVALLTCQLLSSLFRFGKKGAFPLGAAVVASAVAAIPAVMYYGSGLTVQMLFWIGLAGVLALVFTLGIMDVTTGKVFHAGAADSPVPVIVVLAAALCGLEGLILSGVNLQLVAAGLMVATCAYLGGPPLGAAAGAVLGISFLFSGFTASLPGSLQATQSGMEGLIESQSVTMAYVVAGLLAGTFRELRKAGVSLAFVLGLTAYGMAAIPNAAQLQAFTVAGGVSVLIFLLVPRSWLALVPAALVSTGLPDEPGGQPHAKAEPHLLERLRGMSRVLKEVSRTYEQIAAVEAPQEPPGAARVIEQVTDRVCHTCTMYSHCWKKQFAKTYQLYTDLWTHIEDEGPLTAQRLPDQLTDLCIHAPRVASTLDYLYELQRTHDRWERRLEEGRNVVGDYVRNVARLLDRMVEDAGATEGKARVEAAPVLCIRSGIARLPKRGGHISGDSYMAEGLGTGRYFMALSDGMGVGRGAAMESKQCVKLLHDIIAAGFATEIAVNTVNSALLLQSPEETFATVDLSLMDLTTGRAEFVKIGAAPSFIKRGSDITVVKMASVPVGIINQVQVEPEFRLLRPGDIVVMITDGIWDVSKENLDKERWLIHHLSRESSIDPEEIAESLLARALELVPEAGDDMTVLVARVDAIAGTYVPDQRQPGVGQWAPVRQAPSRTGK